MATPNPAAGKPAEAPKSEATPMDTSADKPKDGKDAKDTKKDAKSDGKRELKRR